MSSQMVITTDEKYYLDVLLFQREIGDAAGFLSERLTAFVSVRGCARVHVAQGLGVGLAIINLK